MQIGKVVIYGLGICLLGGIGAIATYLSPLRPSVVVAQLTFSHEAFSLVYSQWSPLEKERCIRHFSYDYLLIIGYISWGYLFGRFAPSATFLSPKHQRWITWLLPFAGLADIVENQFHIEFVSHVEKVHPGWQYAVAGCAALSKWLLGFVFAGLAIRAHRSQK